MVFRLLDGEQREREREGEKEGEGGREYSPQGEEGRDRRSSRGGIPEQIGHTLQSFVFPLSQYLEGQSQAK